MEVTDSIVREALKTVHDPDVFKDIVTLNQVKKVQVVEGNVLVEISTPSPQKEKLRAAIAEALGKLEGVEEVIVNFTTTIGTGTVPKGGAGGGGGAGHAHPPQPAAPHAPRGLKNVRHIIAVGAGKGGVGKSTIAVNLAVGLALMGKKVAVLDGDIYGPSIPTLTGIGPRPPTIQGERILPFVVRSPDGRASVAVMSMGFLVDPQKALIWRGPMAHGAMKQMIEQVEWTHGLAEGEQLDYLIVDLPPGTGDVSLTLAQTVPLTGAVVVATPQEVALADARRAVRMFQQLSIEILGVVENMSQFICDHGTAYDIFGKGGAQVMAQQMGLPFLGDVPIHTSLRVNSDMGVPFENFAAESASRGALMALADMLDKQVAVRLATRPVARPLNLQIS